MKSELSIIIVSYNVRDFLVDCIRSIMDLTTTPAFEVIVVDNASTDGSVDRIRKEFPNVTVIANKENVGFARANNQGLTESTCDFVLLLNPDCVVKDRSLEIVLDFMKRTPDAGMAACRLLNGDGSLQKSIRPFPSVIENVFSALCLDRLLGTHYRSKSYYKQRPFRIDYASGAFLMVRRSALEGMQILNPEYFMYSEEKDLALRLRKRGWYSYFVPSAEVIHFGGQSTGQVAEAMFVELQRSQVKFYAGHYSKGMAMLLTLTYGMVLLSNVFISVPLLLIGRRIRFTLFRQAFRAYPRIVSSVFRCYFS